MMHTTCYFILPHGVILIYMKQIIPYLFRGSVAFYFIYPAVLNLQKSIGYASSPLFKCFTSSYAFDPSMVSLAINVLTIILGLLILVWKHPFTPLFLGALVLISEAVLVKEYTPTFLLLFVPIFLVNVGLLIFYARHHDGF
jgi:hypothetical protein